MGWSVPFSLGEFLVEGPLLLRVVRFLPFVTEHAEAGEVCGQELDKPQGKKPRGRTEGVSGSDELWGFERRQWARQA